MFQQRPGPRRAMIDLRHLDLHCADCGASIPELPFEPKLDRPLYCRDCMRKRRDRAATN